ncbi:MAG: gliding motility-associated C-terminal domain-containing protein, partial [Bacteroidales bacterium]
MNKIIKLTKIIAFIIILFLNNFYIYGQSDTLFWFVAPEVAQAHGDRPIYLRLTSFYQSSNVIIEQPANSGFVPINIFLPADSTVSIDLTNRIDMIENLPFDSINNKGIRIRSNHSITSYYEVLTSCSCNPEIFTLKGRNSLGTNFMIPAQIFTSNSFNTNSFEIVATENNTTVTIIPSKAILGHPANVPYTIILNKGQTYSARAMGFQPSDHLNGSIVQSNKPIAITISDDSASGGYWGGCADLLGDQLIPINIIGKDYIITRGFLNGGNEKAFAMAISDSTKIYKNGNSVPLSQINYGQTLMIDINQDYTYINADKPIYMLHLSGFGCELGMPVLPPIYCTGSNIVAFTRSTSEFFGIILITNNGSQSGFVLNNSTSLVQSSNFSVVPGTNNQWVAARIDMSSNIGVGTGNIISNNLGVFHLGIINGGSYSGCRYGYFSDYNSLNLGPDIVKCPQDTITLSAGNGMSSYLWSTGDTTQSIKTISNGNIWVSATRGLCTLTDTINISYSSYPKSLIPKDTVRCGNNIVIKSANNFSNYLWSNGSNANQINVNSSGLYWVKITDSLNCYNIDTINVTLLKPDILNNDTSICKWNSVLLNHSNVQYPCIWSTNDTTQSISVIPTQTTTYFLTASENNISCKDSVKITVINSPQLTLGNDTAICQGQSITLQASQIFNSYLWSTGVTTQSINVNATGNYWLKGINASGCNGYDTIIVTVNPIPVIQVLPANPSICKEDTITLTALSNLTATTYSWNNGGNTNTIKVSPANTTTYTVIGTRNSCKDTAIVNVIVNPIPVVAILPTNPSICKGESITLTASSNLPSTIYTWSNAATTTTINVSPVNTASYFVVGSLNSCKDTAYINLTVKPLPVLAVSADKNPICEGESTILTVGSNMPSTTYVWNNNVTGNTLSVAPTNSAYYYVTGTASNCHDTSGITINVINQQSINLGDDDYLCVGDEKTLNANNLLGVFLWSNGTSGNTMILNEPGVFWLRVDNNGCISSDTIVLKPCSEIWVPNVFTPNNDGINDIFKANTKEIQKLQLYIYNRWGNLVFETKDINMGWNGKYAGGDAQSGVYYWLIRYNENRSSNQNVEKEIHGSITLL